MSHLNMYVSCHSFMMFIYSGVASKGYSHYHYFTTINYNGKKNHIYRGNPNITRLKCNNMRSTY